MRGAQSIYKTLFELPEKAAAVKPTSQRQQKIEAIIDYYYYNGRREIPVNGRTIRMSYPSLLELVSNTFFLSTFTVHDIIQENVHLLTSLKQEHKDKTFAALQKAMASKWPQFAWN